MPWGWGAVAKWDRAEASLKCRIVRRQNQSSLCTIPYGCSFQALPRLLLSDIHGEQGDKPSSCCGGQLDAQWAPGVLPVPTCISLDKLVQGSKLPPGLCLLALLRAQFRQVHFMLKKNPTKKPTNPQKPKKQPPPQIKKLLSDYG